MTDLEIAVTSVAGARTAKANGATRVELCTALELGGLTPSAGMIDAVLAEVGRAAGRWQGVHVLVRPRPGDFGYDGDDLATYERELSAVLALGVDGVVVGALTPEGRPDMATVHRLAEPARDAGAAVTFHRAIDHSTDPVSAGRALAGVVDRVLSSGGSDRAVDGVTVLAELASVVPTVAGGGVRSGDIPALVKAGVSGVHLSAKRPAAADAFLPLGVDDAGGWWVTDGTIVADAARALDRLR